MSTTPVSGAAGATAYLPHPQGGAAFAAVHAASPVAPARDAVEISAEARRLARDAYSGEVRFDAPHTDDPDFPWEIAHQEWVDLMARVFTRMGEEPASNPALPGA